MKKKPQVPDTSLWEHYKTHIKPLNKKDITVPTPSVSSKKMSSPAPSFLAVSPLSSLDSTSNLLWLVSGSSSHTKLIRGKKVVIEDRLDLHGYTRQEAFATLHLFLVKAHNRNLEWVLIITGKGDPSNLHRLKNLLPQWLDHSQYVSGYAAAKQHHGGGGALYVKIRKNFSRK